ncbi:nucleotidyltransferase domain-containing protein [Lentibacillus lipolyticus]|nr:nucleotidyltransferase domain-containing protein [Lentibacillus lipolyticus]
MGFANIPRERTLIKLKNIILQSLQGDSVNVYLFGSWARREEKRTSDIDIALQSNEDIPIEKIVELREKIEESTLPYHVDLVNLANASSDLTKKVEEEGILWKDCKNDWGTQTGH